MSNEVQHDKYLKYGIRGARVTFRSLDLFCTFATMVTVAVMLHFLQLNLETTYNVVDGNGNNQTMKLFPNPINVRSSYALLAISCTSFTLSLFVVLCYFRSSKLSGKLSTFYTAVELVLAILFACLCYYGASIFQIPKSLNLARNDLWAASCAPLRNPKPNAPPIPEHLQNILTSMCVAGDWSVVCGFISGCLQALLVFTIFFSGTRYYLRNDYRKRNSTLPPTTNSKA